MGIKIYTKQSTDQEFINEWRMLWDKAENANVFNSYDWFLVCKESEKDREFEIYAYYSGNELLGVFPTYIVRRFGIKTVSSILPQFTVGMPILLEDLSKSETFEEIVKYIIKDNNLYIGKLDTKTTKFASSKFQESLLVLIFASPYIEYSNDPFKSSSRNLLKEIRRKSRKVKNMNYTVYDKNSNLEEYLEVIFNIDQNSGKRLRSRDIFSSVKTKNFYKNIAKYCKEYIYLSMVYFDDEPVAYSFNLKYKQDVLGLQCSYLHKHHKYSPGNIEKYELLIDLKGKNIDKIDFGPGMVPYKLRFTKNYAFYYDFYYSRNSLIMLWWKSINFARRCKQILFPEKNSRDHEFLFKKFQSE